MWRHSPVEKSALLVHLALADVANDMHGNELWSSVATIGKKARLGRSTVIEALDVLVANHLLTLVEKRPGHTDLYRFEFPELPVQYLDRSSRAPVQRTDPGVQESDPTRPEIGPELNRTQRDNLSRAREGKCNEWTPLPGVKPPTVAPCILEADHDGPCEPVELPVAPELERADLV